MPSITVNGVELSYEIHGEGPPLVRTPGGWLPMGRFCGFFAGRMSRNFQVLLWDRRNCGRSDIALDFDAPSEWHPYVDDLHEILNRLDMTPAYLAGNSGGCITSLLMARRYPEDVKGLIPNSTGPIDVGVAERIAGMHYLTCADLAEAKGMEAVAQTSGNWWYWPELIERNPDNRDRLLSLDPAGFAALMRRWYAWATSGRWHLAGLTDEELSQVKIPALVTHGLPPDDAHPRESALDLHRHLPNSEWLEYSEHLSVEQISRIESQERHPSRFSLELLSIQEAFLQRVESGDFGTG